MPSNRLHKVQKHIAKKKGKNASLHENSRDSKRLVSASVRDDKLNRLAAVREKQNRPFLIRTQFIQSATADHPEPLALPEIQAIIEQYLNRDAEELETLKAERRTGRPPSTRETLLKQAQASEQGEYTSGFWLPDLENTDNLKKLQEWGGTWAGLQTLKFVRIARTGTIHESSFPPKGMS